MKIFNDLYAFLWNNPRANNCNSYLLVGEKNILIDPGHFHLFGHIQENLSDLSLSIDDIDIVIITHAHPDHMEGIRKFLNTNTMIAVHQTEMDFIKNAAPGYGDSMGIRDFEPHILLKEGDMTIGEKSFMVLNTPGHSPGSICLYYPETKVLFTGDVVFNQGIGRTDLPAGNGGDLKESIIRISRLDVEYLLSGHGDIVAGKENVKRNFEDIQNMWFGYL
jgi:hydroxyacylglutathione hydrolase